MPKIVVKQIAYDSQEFKQAANLRYELFFARHNLPESTVTDPQQESYFHAAIAIQTQIVAYGQLIPYENGIYCIRQMVVAPQYQKQNLGSRILFFLIEQAKKEKAIALTLNARLTATGFYKKYGFQILGKQFPSSSTGILHITMLKSLI